jgi:hypothetical protein
MLKNKGTGAGGKNTNLNGLSFEDKTDFTKFLLKKNYNLKENKCFSIDKNIIYCKQNDFRNFIKDNFEIKLTRKPDGAFINLETKEIFILEMKNQNVEGSVDLKLYAGVCLRSEYEELLPEFKITYCLVLNNWFKKDKYKFMKKILLKHDIKIFYGDDEDFFDKFYLENINKS